MIHAKGGIYFERGSHGEVIVHVYASGAENATELKDVTLDRVTWDRVVSEMADAPIQPKSPEKKSKGRTTRIIDADLPTGDHMDVDVTLQPQTDDAGESQGGQEPS